LIVIKKAKRENIKDILKLIKGLAEYEKLSQQVVATEAILEKEIFDEENAKVILAFEEQTVVGFALYFYNFSTFKGRKGLYLEDLYVLPRYRNLGIGDSLFNYLIKEAKEQKCGRMEWVCLNWNESAKDFYKRKNAKPLSDWIVYRLDESNF